MPVSARGCAAKTCAPRNMALIRPRTDIEKKQTHLSRIHLSLDNIQYGNVARCFAATIGSRNHHVLGLQKPAHDVKNGRLLDTGSLGIDGQRSVTSHEKVKAGRGDERCH